MRVPSLQSGLVLLALALPAAAQQPPPKPSHARAARISEIRGDVAIDNANGSGLQRAYPNLPLREGARLQTGLGRAEIEFEDNSTVRLAPYSAVEFPRLQLLPTGARATTVRLLKGTAYISLIPTYIVDSRGSEFLLAFGQQQLSLKPSSHLRLELQPPGPQPTQAHLAIFDGEAQSPGTPAFPRKKTYTFDLTTPSPPTVASGTHSVPTDNWDRWSAEYHRRLASRPRSALDRHNAGMPHDIF